MKFKLGYFPYMPMETRIRSAPVKPILESVLQCPGCGQRQTEKMPEDFCLYFYECPKCHIMLKAKKGDCCVFCSYGSVPCPPVQLGDCAPAHTDSVDVRKRLGGRRRDCTKKQ